MLQRNHSWKKKVNRCKLHSCLILRNCHQPSVPTTLLSLWLTTLRQNLPPSKKSTAHWRLLGFLVALVVKNYPASTGDPRDAGSTPGSEDPLEEKMATHSSSCLENSMDRGASWAIVHGVRKKQTWLSDWAHYSLRWVFLINIYTFLDTMLLHT